MNEFLKTIAGKLCFDGISLIIGTFLWALTDRHFNTWMYFCLALVGLRKIRGRVKTLKNEDDDQ